MIVYFLMKQNRIHVKLLYFDGYKCYHLWELDEVFTQYEKVCTVGLLDTNSERVYIKRQDFWLPTGVKLIADLQVPCTGAIRLLKGLNYSFSTYRKSKVTHLTNRYSILCLIQAARCQQTTSMMRNKSSTLGRTQPVSFPDVLTEVTKLQLF